LLRPQWSTGWTGGSVEPDRLGANRTASPSRHYFADSRTDQHPAGKSREIIAPMLLTWHKLHYYQELMAGLRGAIAAGDLASHVLRFHQLRSDGDLPAL
jgi:queuine/archaeosine tRNA-ribosyltransferase